MSLTLPTNYANASKSGNIQENWIVRLYYDNEGANDYIGIALSDTTVESVFYHGVITNEPKIRTSINVFESKASTSQISLSIVNFNYKGLSFSEELLYGTRSYINRSVKIYSQLNGASAEADCLQIFEGRFVDISHDNEKISLSVVEQRPWDFIEIPNQRTVSSNNELGIPTYFPVAYGDFNANVSFENNEALCHANLSGQDTNLYPVPVHTYDSSNFFCLAAESDTANSANSSSSVTAHVYEPNIDSFIPILKSSGATAFDNTESYQGGNVIKAPLNMFRAFRFKPTEVGATNQFTVNEYSAFNTAVGANSTSLDTASSANHPPEIPPQPFAHSQVYQENAFGLWNMPSIDGKILFIKVIVSGFAKISTLASNVTMTLSITGTNFDSSGSSLLIGNITSGATSPSTDYHAPFGSTGSANTGTPQFGTFTSDDMATSTFNGSNFQIGVSYTWDVGNLSNLKLVASGVAHVSDIQYLVKSKLEFDATNMSANIERLNKVKILYTGANGLNKTYTGGSGTATKGIEAHRDMLFRYAGFDAADSAIYNWLPSSDGSSLPENNSLGISTARSGWNIAYWCLEPKPLKSILQQLQYEFGFWFKWRADGSAYYGYVKDSYASGDVTQTFDIKDMSGISIRNTSWKDLVTFYDVEFKRHPAKNSRYIKSLSSQDSTNNTRSAFNIQAKENKKSVKLDMNINKAGDADVGANDPNDGFTNYYLNLSGKVRKIISFKVVNPAKAYNLETGDIINFSSTSGDMPVKPFGHDWNESGSQYYMIIDLQRSRGVINLKCLEVG
ncbi:MAG: hypothetical protein Unbinned3556contig1001_19 [Prokaryotic dsDNA virus sp.]|nr:MAG: hypothetical protein Unbinned3556contig1001_19 [Prokaryotic dsDNA virus sp.]|tara:strand:- start:7435 stop:9804 length:2370 start_codon:yes stop_codon:yes gene_type:complete